MGKPDNGLRECDRNIVRMLQFMTHGIRGPLVSTMAGLKVVLHGSYGAMDSGVSDKLEELHANLKRLLGTADDFLLKTCCVEGPILMHREALNLADDIVAAVVEELSAELRSKGICLQLRLEAIPAGTVVAANKLGMKIVLRNLLRNAMAYGGAGCTIVCGYREQPGQHRLNVFNSGTPIPRESHERLFTKFGSRGAASLSGNTGVGLGLYLAREIVAAHGGKIWHEARAEGSDFVFTIPTRTTPPPSDCSDYAI